MKSRIHTTLPGLSLRRQGGEEMDLFLDNSSPTLLRGFQRLHHFEQYGEMEFQFFIGEGFQIWRSEYAMKEKIIGVSRGDISMLELHIPLQGGALHWWDGKKQTRLTDNQFSLDYVPHINDTTAFYEDHVCATLDIHFDIDFLTPLMQQYPILQEFLQKVDGGQPAQLMHNAVRFLSPGMQQIVQEILHYPGLETFAHEYYAGRVALLLHAVLERASGMKHQYSHKKHLDAAMSVREYIERHPNQVHSAKSLSIYAGVEISLLHKIFKEYHGATLFDFSQQLRLQHAKLLLADTSLYIQDIADTCGYPEHTNFSKAFRKRFGFTPQQYREAVAKTGRHHSRKK